MQHIKILLKKKRKVLNLIMDNKELAKLIVIEKDKITLRYKQKINNIKQHYGVEFDVEYSKNNEIKNITFINLRYKNLFTNVTIVYNGLTGKFDYIDYDLLETRTFKNLNHKRLIPNLDKEYKLKLIVAEINRLNMERLNELNEIDNSLNNTSNLTNSTERSLLIEKDEETD